MSDLPSRERVADLGCTASSPEEAEQIEAILVAYRVGELKTAAEWRETINWDAAIELARTFRNLEWNARAVKVVLVAAIGDTDEGNDIGLGGPGFEYDGDNA